MIRALGPNVEMGSLPGTGPSPPPPLACIMYYPHEDNYAEYQCLHTEVFGSPYRCKRSSPYTKVSGSGNCIGPGFMMNCSN